jgi:hypothetical protein
MLCGFEEYDFRRNPVVENQVFFPESKCAACGFSVPVRSMEESSNTKDRTEPNVSGQAPSREDRKQSRPETENVNPHRPTRS